MSLLPFIAARRANRGPFFHRGDGRVDERFSEIQFGRDRGGLLRAAAAAGRSGRTLPQSKALTAGLIRRIAAREIVPARPGAEHPQHRVQHRPDRSTAAPAIGAAVRTKAGFDHGPLGVRRRSYRCFSTRDICAMASSVQVRLLRSLGGAAGSIASMRPKLESGNRCSERPQDRSDALWPRSGRYSSPHPHTLNARAKYTS
jgi:hypothetical protein